MTEWRSSCLPRSIVYYNPVLISIPADCFYTIITRTVILIILKLKHSPPQHFSCPKTTASCLHLLVFNLGDAAITSLPQHSTQKIAAMDGVDIPPPGGDQNRGPVVIAVLSLFFGLSTIIVSLRVVTRIWITRNFGWDDATMALTQVRSVPTWTKKC